MKSPCLTPEIVADDDALALAIQDRLLGSGAMRRLTRRVRRAQDRLQRVVNREAWARYMVLEEHVNDRSSQEVDLLIRWAFEAGKRHGVAVGVRLVSCPSSPT
ncbi:MAG: hypothetical protein ACRELB_13335 [Polyangiaceae bacterium]